MRTSSRYFFSSYDYFLSYFNMIFKIYLIIIILYVIPSYQINYSQSDNTFEYYYDYQRLRFNI